MPLAYTRAMVRAILNGSLASVAFTSDPIFGLAIAATCRDVPSEVLNARATWSNPAAYDASARRLAGLFANNFKQHAAGVSEAVVRAGPQG
jgi:phosphoenolpyruvate carboxykinase (ATP)